MKYEYISKKSLVNFVLPRDLYNLYNNGASVEELSERFNINSSHIKDIIYCIKKIEKEKGINQITNNGRTDICRKHKVYIKSFANSKVPKTIIANLFGICESTLINIINNN